MVIKPVLFFILFSWVHLFIVNKSYTQTLNNSSLNDQFTEQTSIILSGVYNSSVCWGDYNNDNNLDILVTGNTGQGAVSKIYRNNGNNTFTEQSAIQLVGVSESSAAWGDYNNDGNLDILLCGNGNNLNRLTKIYKNNGNNTFSELTSINLVGVWGGSAVWGDCDNDGDLDIILTGNSQYAGAFTQIYFNNGDNTFSAETENSLIGVYYSSVALGDCDNDGDLDIFLTGYTGNNSISKLYLNNGNGIFSEQPSLNIDGVKGSSVAWGDYDNDGDLDILICGITDANKPVSKIYKNDGLNTFSEQVAILLAGAGYGSSAWGDYDNDGDLDIVLTGSGDSNIAKIYKNNGDNTFTEQTSITLTSVRNSSVAWGDYDNDGDLDLLLTGYSNGMGIAKLYRNNNFISNTLPSIPTNLSATVNDQSVTLRWNRSNDNETLQNGLKYNLVIGTAPHSMNIMSPMSDRSSGQRKIITLGNTNHDTIWTIKGLPLSKYYWSVQAIDNNSAGSNFAPEQNFIVTGTKLILEGLFNLETKRLNMRDTIKVYLRNFIYPYSILDSAISLVDTVNFISNPKFFNASIGNYYLVISHRNSIETWSSSALSFTGGSSISYDFTTDSSKAFGNNMKKIGEQWCFYTGEVANNDQFIDGDDITAVFNAQGLSGYSKQDVTGDMFVDGDDVSIIFNNQGIHTMSPLSSIK